MLDKCEGVKVDGQFLMLFGFALAFLAGATHIFRAVVRDEDPGERLVYVVALPVSFVFGVIMWPSAFGSLLLAGLVGCVAFATLTGIGVFYVLISKALGKRNNPKDR